MKAGLLNASILAAVAALGLHTAVQAEEIQPREVTAIVSETFVPNGFDSNTDAYVVVSGLFPNGCYRWKRADVDHVAATTHEVRVIATVRPGVCPRMLIPFSEEVKLGTLSAGAHNIKIVNGDGTYFEKKMKIEE
ncbi:MAG: hypothetical protein ACK5P5_11945 [Pseudobdellovibrionaceae bacterium]|jgi:hypothetical protein